MLTDGTKVLVVGVARSGIAAALTLAKKGAAVTICDVKSEQDLGAKVLLLKEAGVTVVAGGYPTVTGNFELVIASPGVPAGVPPFVEAVKTGVPVWSEMELAYRYSPGEVVAVTGTNGKTTTTALIGEMFRDAGEQVVVAGNIGSPLIAEVANMNEHHVAVLEVSSFQLEWVDSFRPKVAVVLNITPDHLDRHGTMENYAATKAKIFGGQTGADYTVLNYDDPLVRKMSQQTKGQVIFFSNKHSLEAGIFVEDGIIKIKQEEVYPVTAVDNVAIKGGHNIENALAAVAVGWAMGLPVVSLAATLASFAGVEHRLEFVRQLNGVQYINDSKGTNPDASIKALEAFANPIVLIAGGRNKGSDFSNFAQIVKQKAKEVILLGEAAQELRQALLTGEVNNASIHQVEDYQQALSLAEKLSQAGDIVLLSPACASWDMFDSYEERGDLFKELVNELRG